MLTAGTVIFAAATYLLMVVAFYQAKARRFHIPVMAGIILIDLCFPVYLYLTRDWIRRLFDEGEIFSFLIWMHLILVITLYLLYFFQVQTARRILSGDGDARPDHRSQAKGILIVRALVIMTGALLAESPESAP
ncbi:MAG TPA: hypothetical protein ENK48_07460 [Gammaproteobacteria bacterium]|nr:hypothetical protein [Gammaproteobacteria bacterium]